VKDNNIHFCLGSYYYFDKPHKQLFVFEKYEITYKEHFLKKNSFVLERMGNMDQLSAIGI
jgi:hypothetical protein